MLPVPSSVALNTHLPTISTMFSMGGVRAQDSSSATVASVGFPLCVADQGCRFDLLAMAVPNAA